MKILEGDCLIKLKELEEYIKIGEARINHALKEKANRLF